VIGNERLRDVLERLEGVRKCGAGYEACCPAHDDRHASLSIAIGDAGRVLVHCHAGCPPEDVCHSIKLSVADLMPVGVDSTPRRGPKNRVPSTSTRQRAVKKTFSTPDDALSELERTYGRASASWEYHDAGGETVGLIYRWDRAGGSKDILPVSQTSTGWIIGGMPTPRPLYRLPELAQARRVYVCEGEKAVDAVRGLELTATTSPHGCKSAKKADWSPLAGKQCVVLPDNDDAGRRYADDVARWLAPLKPAPTVRRVELPGLPPGGDAVEYIEARRAAGLDNDAIRAGLEGMADRAESVGQVAPLKGFEVFRPFPVDALPEPMRRFVSVAASALGCDASYVALPVLAVAASCIGNSYRVILKRGWTEPAVLWCAIVGESGSLKSPAFRLALRPLRRAQQRANKEYQEALSRHQAEVMRFEAAKVEWKKRGCKTDPPVSPEAPELRRLMVSDVTVEALAPILLANPRGLLLSRDELSGWVGGFDRYAAGGKGADASNWLSMYDAEAVIVDRKTGNVKTIFVPAAAVSVVGTIQPGTLTRVFTREHRENGMLARLLLTMPARKPALWTETEIHESIEGRFAELIDTLLNLAPGLDEEGDPRPRLIPLDPEAKAVFVAWHDDHARELNEATGDLAAGYSKLKGICARLALVIHCVRVADRDSTLQDPAYVDAASVTCAIRMTEWFKAEAYRVYAMLAETDDDRERRELVELIKRKGGSATVRELNRSSRMFANAADAEAALEGLVEVASGTGSRSHLGRGVEILRNDSS